MAAGDRLKTMASRACSTLNGHPEGVSLIAGMENGMER